MADLTYNQGIHGAQDTANAMVRAGRTFHVVTDDWRSDSFREAVGRWARAAAAVTRWRSLRVGVFGYAMNGMGDIRVDVHTLVRTLGPEVVALAPGDLVRAAEAVAAGDVDALIADEDARFEIDPRLSRAEREDHARMQLGLERVLGDAGCRAYSTHFGAIAEDGRFARLPLAAASSLMARGYGFGAEGDALTAALMSAGRNLLGETQFTEMYAMDFPSDSILMSHMGEGNWRLARADRPVRLIKRPLGIGGLEDPPTFLFQYAPGPATLATLVALGGERFRLVVGRGRGARHRRAAEAGDAVRDVPAGAPACARAWTRGCGSAARTTRSSTPATVAADWEVFCELAGIELARASIRPACGSCSRSSAAAGTSSRSRRSRVRRSPPGTRSRSRVPSSSGAAVEAAGFEAFAVAPFREPPARKPLVAVDLEREEQLVREVLMGSVARERVPATRAVCERWRPDVLVCDEVDAGSMAAAELHGVPYATVIENASGTLIRPDLVAEATDGWRAELGLPPGPRHALLLSPFPPSLRDPPPDAVSIRPVFEPGAGSDWPAGAVFFTLGTVFNLEAGDLFTRVVVRAAVAGRPGDRRRRQRDRAGRARDRSPRTCGSSATCRWGRCCRAAPPSSRTAARARGRGDAGTRVALGADPDGRRPAGQRRALRGAGRVAGARGAERDAGRRSRGGDRCADRSGVP